MSYTHEKIKILIHVYPFNIIPLYIPFLQTAHEEKLFHFLESTDAPRKKLVLAPRGLVSLLKAPAHPRSSFPPPGLPLFLWS